MNNASNLTKVWSGLCPPAQIYPAVMAGVVLFNVYRGTYRHALTHLVSLIIGTTLLWVLCAAKMEVVAYAMLALPVFFFVVLLAIIFYDQSLLKITRAHVIPPCEADNSCDVCPACGHHPCDCIA
jgi:hypothetical protein